MVVPLYSERMASSLKNAPSFNPEADDYASWRSDVEVWRLLSDIKPEKIGPAVYLALQGKARDFVRTVSLEEIGSEEGFGKIIAKLDGCLQARRSCNCVQCVH